jgi:transmembrane sensor
MKIINHPVIKRLFADYQSGNIQQNDKQIIDSWFNSRQNEDFSDVFAGATEESRIHQELTGRLSACINDKPVRSLWYNPTWIKAACVVAVVSATAMFILKNRQQAPAIQQATYQTITTENNQIKKILLDDGTQVWLNSASRLRFGQPFNTGKQRMVYLDKGEAYFEVKHDVEHPFKVLSGSFQTTVLGTSFNIRAYNIEKEYKVAVAVGKVSVGITGKDGRYTALSKGLVKGQLLKYHPSQKNIQVLQSPAALQLGWITGGDINIDGLNLKDIGEELARTYNLKVKVTHPEYDTEGYTIRLNHNNLSQALKQLTLKTGMSYKLENDHLTINPQNPLMK